MRPSTVYGLLIAMVLVVTPVFASETPYMDTVVDFQSSINQNLAESAIIQEHFPNEIVTVVLQNEYFTLFFENGQVTEVMPGRFDRATLIIETDEQTIESINQGKINIADAITLKQISYSATEHASLKTKIAVKLSKLTSSVVYFFDSLFTR